MCVPTVYDDGLSVLIVDSHGVDYARQWLGLQIHGNKLRASVEGQWGIVRYAHAHTLVIVCLTVVGRPLNVG